MTGKPGRRGDGTFGELVPAAVALTEKGNESFSSPGAVDFTRDDFAWQPIPNNTDFPVLLPAFRLRISGVGAAVPESGSALELLFASLSVLVFLQQWKRRFQITT